MIRQTREQPFILDMFFPVPGGIQQIFLEARIQPGKLLLDPLESILPLLIEFDTGKPEITQLILDQWLNSSESAMALKAL